MDLNIDMAVIENKMYELETIIKFEFRNIHNLANAMCVIDLYREGYTSVRQNQPDYYNSALATVGDAVAKAIISEKYFKSGYCKGKITKEKIKNEKNEIFHKITKEKEIYKYAFNKNYFFTEAPDNEKLPNSGHDLYFEAIVGAIYFDSGFDSCKQWLNNFFDELEINIE